MARVAASEGHLIFAHISEFAVYKVEAVMSNRA